MTGKAGSATIPADRLRAFAQGVFERAGLPREHATLVAEVLVWANLRGVDTHGVLRIPRYLDLIGAGDMNPRPDMKVASESPATALLDADRAIGPVAMVEGMRLAIGKARTAGVGFVVVRATTHTAVLGYYTRRAADEGMASMAWAGSGPNMAYHGARAAGVSTSPISIGVPGGAHGPVVLDMATGIVSMGRIMQARRTGEALPPGAVLDKAGLPTTDPKAAHIPLSMAGPKGSGLALMIELLSGVLASNAVLADALSGAPEGRRHRQNGAVLAIDIARFGDPAAFAAEVERLVGALKRLPPDPEAGEILVPGERGDRIARQRSRDGIPLPPAVASELAAVAGRLGVPPL